MKSSAYNYLLIVAAIAIICITASLLFEFIIGGKINPVALTRNTI